MLLFVSDFTIFWILLVDVAIANKYGRAALSNSSIQSSCDHQKLARAPEGLPRGGVMKSMKFRNMYRHIY